MKCKLLVAEDELIERKVLCKTLQKYLGDLITLYEAKNGREAIEIFEREAPQAAILDIEMPGANGLEVARKIRETDKRSDMSSIESHRCRFDNDSHYTVFDHVMKKSALLPLPHVGHGDQSQTIASTEKGIGKGLHVFDARSLIIRQNGTRRNTFDLRKAFLRVRRNTRNAPWSLSEQHIGLLPRLHSWDCTTTLNRCTCP